MPVHPCSSGVDSRSIAIAGAGAIAVTPTMGAYQPSSLGDYLAGREVEVEAIWGEPLWRGSRCRGSRRSSD